MGSTSPDRSHNDSDNMKKEPMDCSPANMSMDDNDDDSSSEEKEFVGKKLDRRLRSVASLSEDETIPVDKNVKSENAKNGKEGTGNRILKRKKKRYDWEEIILNKGRWRRNLGKDHRVFKLTVSNFPTYWDLEKITRFIAKMYGPVDMFYKLIDSMHVFMGSIQLHFKTKAEWKKAWKKIDGARADEQKVFAHLKDKDSDSESETEKTEEPPVKKPKEEPKKELPAPTLVDVWEPDPSGLYGLKPEYLASLGITPPIDKWVRVTNVRCERNELKEVMELAGEVLACNIFLVANIKYAKVCYSHPLEAVQAVSMLNDQEFYGVKLKVALERPETNTTPILPKGLKNIGPGLGALGFHVRDVVRQYERYVKGLHCDLNTNVFLERKEKSFGKKTHPQGPNYLPKAPLLPVPFGSGNGCGPQGPPGIMAPLPIGPIPVAPVMMPGPHGPGPMGPGPGAPGPMGPMGPGPGAPGPMGPMGPGPGAPGPMGPSNCWPTMGPIMNGPRGPGPIRGPGPGPRGPIMGPRGPIRSPIVSPRPPDMNPVRPQECVTVELFNLPLSTTFTLLSDKMAECGQVMSVQLGAPGCAAVVFANRLYADRCFQKYNNCSIMGNIITVKYK